MGFTAIAMKMLKCAIIILLKLNINFKGDKHLVIESYFDLFNSFF